MGISLAPELDTANTTADPTKKPPVVKPVPMAAPSFAPAPSIGLAPQQPGKAGGTPSMTAPAPMTAPGIPAPTVAAPSAPVDRVKLATDTFNQSAASTQGAYDAASRDNIHHSAALGQIASGGLRTREGDLQLARGRDLDLLRQKLVTNATEGSIADAQTAYGQALAGSQQGLAEKIGLAGIDAQKGSLDLEKEKFATGSNQTQQQIDLAKEGQSASIEQQHAALALQEKLGLGGLSADQQRIAIAQKQQELDTAFNAGKMSLAERDAARADLAQAQQNTLATGQLDLAKTAQAQSNANDQQRIQLAKDQLAQTGEQFGLSLAQQHELATLADKTQNRQLDISTAQGKNSLLLELARIMGAKDSDVDPNFLAAIAQSLGVALPGKAGGSSGGGTTGGGDAMTPVGKPVGPTGGGGGTIDPMTGKPTTKNPVSTL